MTTEPTQSHAASQRDFEVIAQAIQNTYDDDVRIEALAALKRVMAALRIIGTPAHVPQGFDPLEWWQHTASKRGEIARDALGVTAEELIRDRWENANV